MGVTVRQKKPGKDNPWWIFVNHQGKRKAKCVGDRKTAENVAAELRIRLSPSGLGLDTLPRAVPLFKDYAKQWLETYVATCCRGTTPAGYETSLRIHLLPALGEKRLDEIRRSDVKTLVFALAKKELSPSTILNVRACLSGILSSAIEDEIITSNPAARLGKYIKRNQKPEVDVLTKEETAKLLEAVRTHRPHYYPLFLCALRTGMRIGELLGLEWGDIDFNSLFIKVQRAQVRGVIGPPKNGRSRRVDMSRQLAEVLSGHRTQLRREALREGRLEIPERVFLTERGASIDLDHFRRRLFHPCLEKAGLRRIRIHDLRHTYASLLIAQKESLAYIRDQLGHGSIKITVDTYGHLVPGSNRAAVDQLDDVQPFRNQSATSNLILAGRDV